MLIGPYRSLKLISPISALGLWFRAMNLIFDFDGTLVDYYGKPFPHIHEQLQGLKDKGYKLYVCSFNGSIDQCLKETDLGQYFSGVGFRTSFSKTEMINVLGALYGFSPSSIRYFDDDPNNVRDCRLQGIRAYHVDPFKGVTEYLLEEALTVV